MRGGMKIRVGTLNIFNNIFHHAREQIFNYSSEYANSISRQHLLYSHLFATPLDIICLQEVDLFMVRELKRECTNYDLTLHSPVLGAVSPKSNNCCVIYKKSYKLLGERHFDLEKAVQKHFTNYSSESRCEIQDAFLRELTKRQSAATMILLELSEEDHGNAPHTHLSGVYELITTGKLSKMHAHHPAQLRNDEVFYMYPDLNIEPFKSAFKEVNGNEPVFTNKTETFSGCIDFIFYKGLVPISAETTPNQLSEVERLPNSTFPSDHILLTSEMFLV
ncbi:carbon catabolite repressor protein 4, putative [Plasmodium ovale wallikeri]|uniref:Carbon catabolite repressor protein 4, putative n=1 Tax=Plasmodium ovale wallikeri TaxID=864142 RepID=A0A1A8YIC2_PLAOA|nr:carbon catabolite repressor protein 4, putative [Plasmodium ovale wallikeri]SBT31291.1 carbon catabolite repressor protein 4, putative [Plasmodium ovale wallikeri]